MPVAKKGKKSQKVVKIKLTDFVEGLDSLSKELVMLGKKLTYLTSLEIVNRKEINKYYKTNFYPDMNASNIAYKVRTDLNSLSIEFDSGKLVGSKETSEFKEWVSENYNKISYLTIQEIHLAYVVKTGKKISIEQAYKTIRVNFKELRRRDVIQRLESVNIKFKRLGIAIKNKDSAALRSIYEDENGKLKYPYSTLSHDLRRLNLPYISKGSIIVFEEEENV